jgi:hypothetical protein
MRPRSPGSMSQRIAMRPLNRAPLFQNPPQHDSACHRETEAEQDAGGPGPTPKNREGGAYRHEVTICASAPGEAIG